MPGLIANNHNTLLGENKSKQVMRWDLLCPERSEHPLCPQSSGQPVPLVVESCIRFINLNGKPGTQYLAPI